MPGTRSKENLFGFFEKKTSTTYRSGSVTKRDLEQQAFKAGQRSGDTGLFKDWVRSKKLGDKWGAALRDFEGAYRKGVERGEAIEAKKEVKRAEIQDKKEEKREQKLELAKTISEVSDALVDQGMAKGKAQHLARTKYAKGDSFEDLWRKVLSRVPKDNPAASERALKSAGYRLVDRYSDRSVAMDTARNYVPYRVVYQTPGGMPAKWEVWTKQAGNPKGGKFDRCVKEVSTRGGAQSPYAVCEKSVGRENPAQVGERWEYSYRAKKGGKWRLLFGVSTVKAISPDGKITFSDGRSIVNKGDDVLVRRPRQNPSRKNPLDGAEKMYTEMTGLEPTEVMEFKETEHFHKYTSVIGMLVCLDILTVDGRELPLIAPGFSFSPARFLRRDIRHSSESEAADGSWILDPKFPKDKLVYVTFDEKGRQMIFRGGDQAIPFKSLGLNGRDERDNMFIGTIVQITYRGKKSFEMDGKEEVDFHHEFGQQGSNGIMPLLHYLPLVQRMTSSGGRYKIAPVRSDIGASPGIVG
jgi:hypothetical protein